jgi:hypothetical protein
VAYYKALIELPKDKNKFNQDTTAVYAMCKLCGDIFGVTGILYLCLLITLVNLILLM